MYNRQSEDVMLKENTIDWNQIHVDELLASGATEANAQKRTQIYNKIQEILVDEPPL